MKISHLKYSSYINFIQKFRVILLAVLAVSITLFSLLFESGFVYSDKTLWLNGSESYTKLLLNDKKALNIEKVTIDISKDGWNANTIQKLKELEKQLLSKKHIVQVNSLFGYTSLYNNSISETQSLTEITSLYNIENKQVISTVLNKPDDFKKFKNGNFITFYIISDGYVSLEEFQCSYPYERSTVAENVTTKDILLFSILIIILATLFTITFKSILPTFLGVIFIFSTTLITVVLFQHLSHVNQTHISIVLLAVTVSVMDFVYIYYKWHVFQNRTHGELLLYKVIARTFSPIFWTSITSVIGIGSLIFVDSHILQTMGLNVALSSSVGFILSFTLLPVLLSFFSVKNPAIITKKSVKFFADKESHYDKQWLNIFLTFSFIVLLFGVFIFFYKPINVVTDKYSTQIKASLQQKGFNAQNLKILKNIQDTLRSQFETIDSFKSPYTEIEKFYLSENRGSEFEIDKVDIDSYIFMFDLFDMGEDIYNQEHMRINIYLHSSRQNGVILEYLKKSGLIIEDSTSLLQVAKMDSINTLFSVVFFVLVLIMLIIYFMTRTYQFVIIALFVNGIPLSWFFAIVMILNIPLSTEMLVSMIITLALSSDATMHFISHYHHNRKKPRSAQKTLENSFLYIGTPLGIGNVILLLTFVTLIFVPDPAILNIVIFSTILIVISLSVELFVLPVLYLNMIKNNTKIQERYHRE